ncbi:RHS repeat-associated core domain-containing protein [Streptomyces gardneri]|uniref:polymorphic toxin-type HINT domain-containing protein n=1 Tax=Streptomyces gardneri TaxID=66892 RepID=UPI00099E60F9|nr:polymorphic toxin-type HINT domain-containing protein [Streptomyces gardneri]QPK50800.1 RHS repeat-associated core domain-containing protein [Streptomyces gardneri]WRK42169.1 polymorphic toxin-type HINT domain-containing protein [Streptomyces venezuelae]
MPFGIGITRRRIGGPRRERRRFLVHPLALALVVPVGLVPVAQAADGKGGLGRPDLPEQRVSKVKVVDSPGAQKARAKVAADQQTNAAQARRALAEQTGTWPRQGKATLTLAGGKAGKAQPGGVPVTLEPKPRKRTDTTAATAQVTVLDQKAADKAGITGVLLTAEADTASPAGITVDYSAFASKIGGGWAQRLQLVQLPDCVLTTPEKADCRKQTPLKSTNNVHAQSVSAQVTLPETEGGVSTQLTTAASGTTSAMVLAVTASAAGAGQSPSGAGDYSATPLAESSSWQAGSSSGSFTWSHDFRLPPAAAGPMPSLSLSYTSGSIDGRTAATNNQGTSVGEGFSLTESYIERSYGSCEDDGQTDVSDLCWKYDNARLILNGSSSRLVKDTTTGTWRLENDDASTVTRSTGADNKDSNGEYWTVTKGDGTRYVFGLDKLDGATTERTNSTWTVPVFGDDSGEPGYSDGSNFADRSLTQAWRWNLDYVEDVHGNASTYWYTKEENYYKKNKATTADASYVRGGYLKEIKYGLRKGALFTDDADAKVTFDYAERCTVTDCGSLTEATADNWPDVPFDALCSSGDDKCLASSPAFFSRKRLTDVNTFSWSATTSTYDPVDSWALTQKYLDGGDIGDTSDHVLTLQSIKRTGKAGATAIALDPITFTYQTRPNRVDATDDILPLTRHRISTITSETGAITTVTLSSPECVRGEVTGAAEDTNTRSCYPQYWNINGSPDASVDWFHKYRVLAVTVSDPAGQNEAVEHSYEYTGAAWHHNDAPFTPKDERTWSDWRGYRQVTAYTGALQTTRSKTVSLYMQGMDGDRKKDGTTKSVTIAPLTQPDVGLATLTDSAPYAGQLRETVVYNGAQPISVSAYQPWSKETARQSDVPDSADHVARYVRTKQAATYTYLTASNTWRHRTVQTTYDDYGMPVTEEDSGLYGTTGDETCKVTWYARDAAAGLTAFASRTRAVGRSCSVVDSSLDLPTDSTRRGDVLSDSAVAYDGATTWSPTMKPTRGLATWTGRAQGYGTAGAVNWQKTATTTYDDLGRPLSVTNADGKTGSTAYTPATAGPLTKTIVTDPKSFKTATFLDPRRGQRERVLDANLKKTELVYDALGRLTDVWLPDRNRTAGYSPSSRFAYFLSNTRQSWVSTATLKKDGSTYNTSYAIVDSLLRPLQTQSPTPQGGRLLTDTRFNSRGLAYETYAAIFDNATAPNGSYTRAEYGEAPTQTETVFDGAGRETTSSLYVFGRPKWSTSTSYTGDSTAITALQGGSAARTITDVRGQAIESREYAGPQPADIEFDSGPSASYMSTKFAFALDGRQTAVTGPDGAQWSYGFDLFGRQTSSKDPDKGKVTTVYNLLDAVIKSTDSRGTSVLTEYDEIGRPTATWSGTKDDANQLTAHTYDTLLKGLPTSSTRYVGGKKGQAYTKSVTAYDTLSRPVGGTLQLPAEDPLVKAGAPASLAYTSSYNVDGTLQNSKEPALGGLQAEVIGYGYDTLGNLTSIGGSTGYLLDVDYSALAQPQQLVMGTANTEEFKKAYVTQTFEEGTGRLTRSHVTDQTHPYMLQDLNYTFDQAGNVTSITDPTTLGGTSAAETQCFAYDGHRRLTEAWTPTSQNCSNPRSAASLSGPAPYWTSYTYNDAGQRATEKVNKTTGSTETTYCYKGTQPHALTGTSTTANCTTPTRTYTYDTTGNTTKRPGKTGTQDLTWSPEGKLTKLTESGKNTDYLYDAGGNLLIRTTQGGERILYAGATELHLRANGTTWAQRYYTSGGVTVAVRSNEGGTQKLTYLAGDHHGTQSLALSADAAQTFSKRRMTPFGAERGTPSGTAWPDDKGFLGKTDDKNTGLTHIGAREYDSSLGQFVSVDPLLSLDQSGSLNGYSYANQNPTTASDPTGLESCYPHNCSGSNGTNGPYQEANDPAAKKTPKNDKGTVSADSSGSSSDNSGGNSHNTTTTSSTAQPVLYGTTLPTEEEMRAMPLASPGDTYEELAKKWARNKCYGLGGRGESAEAFCGAANEAGLLDVGKDPWGVQANVNCITGKGDCAEALVSDVITLFTWGFGRLVGGVAAKTAAKAASGGTAGAATSELALVRLLGCKCFLAGTEVLMADGSTKPIEDVKLGDMVQATDPETGEAGPREVTRLIRTESDKHFNTLSIATDEGVEELTATHEHPFWSPSQSAWIEAGDLQPGMTLLTGEGATVIVTGNKAFTRHARTYNLTVDDLHTYYVLAGETPVLVHNSNGLCGTAALENGDWQHILDRHRPGGAKVDDKSGIFTGKAKNVRGRIAETINRGTPRPNTPDPETGRPRAGQIYEWDFGVPVGRAGPANGGGELTGIRVVVNDGKVVTAFPF